MTSPTLPSAVLGTATLFLRPLRHLLDIETAVAVLRNPLHQQQQEKATDDVLARLLVHVSVQEDLACKPQDNDHDQDKDHDLESVSVAALLSLLGRWVALRVHMELLGATISSANGGGAARDLRVQYQFSPATESYVHPVDHTTVVRVLVTEEFVAHVSTSALRICLLDGRVKLETTEEEPQKTTPRAEPKVAMAAVELNTDALKTVTEAAAAAAQAAKEAAVAAEHAAHATATRDAARETERLAEQQQRLREEQERCQRELTRAESEQQRAKELLELEAERLELQRTALSKDLELERERLAVQVKMLEDDKAQAVSATAQLATELQEKQQTLDHWRQQSAATEQAIELLKQRMAADANEREQLQKRLRVLEAEKQELLRKSRACVVQ